MAWSGRFAGRYHGEAEYWKQRVSNENLAKRNFENTTHQHTTAKFFQGAARDQHEELLRTTGNAADQSQKAWYQSMKLPGTQANSPKGAMSPLKGTQSPREQDAANRSKSEIKNILVYGRHNREVPVYTKFESQPYDKVHNQERMQATNVGDGIIDPHQTISGVKYDVLAKDFGYEELNKRTTRVHDYTKKVINDDQARVLIKIDEKYGMQNGGLFGQSTFNHEQLEKSSIMSPGGSRRTPSRDLGAAGTQIMSSDKTLRNLQQQKIEIMERILQNDRQQNELMCERLGQKTLSKALHDEIRKVDGRGPALDSQPEVLGTAWSMHQHNSVEPDSNRKVRIISKTLDIRAQGLVERDLKRLVK